ncbi:uncharacterized protein LOC129764269 [Toxorhynchites rutilus septentrionalis]|uniref:uncharacterized protein LOC129764269 n=1 Tax=Toxorhynchites rutilus septentrionalis TaxID=329112 RepID=UPI0024784C0D|nr:uncharacterized protein LOC129764269 [Toxorhynchites rutilus septentrionalis]
MSDCVPIHTIHNAFDMLGDPIHLPITIGNEQFIITQQDQRSVLDRRTWFLSRPVYNAITPTPPTQFLLCFNEQQILQLLLASLTVRQPFPIVQPPWVFHYEKQTSTDDLPYFARKSDTKRMIDRSDAGPVVKHVHFIVDQTHRQDAAVNTNSLPTPPDVTMECDPGEGTSGNMDSSMGPESAYDHIKNRKKQVNWFW